MNIFIDAKHNIYYNVFRNTFAVQYILYCVPARKNTRSSYINTGNF